tara:strand:- start:301 stop:531 length:231 start_codon:yes stop_codon:yes gene_type:complete
MNTNLFFLLGTVVVALLGSLILWLTTRPKRRSANLDEVQKALRGVSQNRPRRIHNPDGIRVVGNEKNIDPKIRAED